MNHEELLMAGNAIANDLLYAGGTPEAFKIASERIKALPVSEDEYIGHVLVEFDATNPTPEQRARFLAAVGFAPPNETRLQAAQRLYWTYRESLRDAVCEDYPRAFPSDVDRIIARLNDNLPAYRGAKSKVGFLAWAIRFVYREAELDRRFYEMFKNSRKRVLKRIWDVLLSATDLGLDPQTVADIENETWLWLRTDKTSPLYTDGTASASTRLCAHAYWLARGWKTSQLRNRSGWLSASSDEALFIAASDPYYPPSACKPRAE